MNSPRKSSWWMNEKEAAEFLNVSVSGLRKWRTRGLVKYYQFGRLIRYNQADLDVWAEAHSTGTQRDCQE